MTLEDYKSNSNRSREQEVEHDKLPERKTEKVVTGVVKQRKKTGLAKFSSIFLPGEVSSVKDYILTDVLIPSIKKGIHDIVCNGIDILLGENLKKSNNPAGKVSYRQYYKDPDDRREYAKPRAQMNYSYDDVIFDNRGDAEEVLCRMEELLTRFDVVSVADFFDLSGISCSYTDNKYGWTDLQEAHVERVRDGYIVVLPRATSL